MHKRLTLFLFSLILGAPALALSPEVAMALRRQYRCRRHRGAGKRRPTFRRMAARPAVAAAGHGRDTHFYVPEDKRPRIAITYGVADLAEPEFNIARIIEIYGESDAIKTLDVRRSSPIA